MDIGRVGGLSDSANSGMLYPDWENKKLLCDITSQGDFESGPIDIKENGYIYCVLCASNRHVAVVSSLTGFIYCQIKNVSNSYGDFTSSLVPVKKGEIIHAVANAHSASTYLYNQAVVYFLPFKR